MASLSAYYPQPVVAGTTAGTYAEGNDSRISQLGAGSVVTSTGSTTARSLADRFGETVKVADFGAVGNGTTDDAAAIQLAIDYAISLGNAVIEFEPKTYNLVATKAYRSTAQYPIIKNRCHLDVHGGTNETNIIFKGNGAVLYTNVAGSSTIGEMLLIASRLNSISFYDITFERGSAQRSSLPPADGSVLVAMFPVSEDSIEYVKFNGVTFINGMSFHASNRAYSVSKTFKKIKTVEMLNCQFLYPFGSGSTYRVTGSGGQMLNLSSWIDTLIADGCYIDGAVGGKVPTWSLPVDGWLYFNPYHNYISNCHFRHCSIEAIYCQTPWNIVALINGFTQPAVGATVTVTAKAIQENNNEELTVGKLYTVQDLDIPRSGYSKPWAHGVYRLESWQQPIEEDSEIVLRRVSDEYVVPPEPALEEDGELQPTGTVFSNNCRLVMLDDSEASASIDSCTFTGESITDTNGQVVPKKIVVTDGGSGYISAPTISVSHGDLVATATISGDKVSSINFNYFDFTKYDPDNPPTLSFSGGGGSGAEATVDLFDWRHDPAIAVDVGANSTISNCYFNCVWGVRTGTRRGDFGKVGPNNIVNNVFYVRNSKIKNNIEKLDAVHLLVPYSVISNNTFIADDANELDAFIQIGKSNSIITNNAFVARIASTGGYESAAIRSFNTNDNKTWETYIDNNYCSGLHYGVKGIAPCQIGQMRGSYLTAPVAFSGGDFKGSQLFLVSPNGTRKIISVTNDDEIQITT